ncbi:MAG: SpoVA/SpoVAEb family sporulation membrane protein [Clostridiales bacterium]|nr:SpoVA/SpoVAEb family sporulation membrane protein [Clostridiales bacterium]
MIFVKAFVVGGLICVIGQLLIDITKLTPGRILVSFVIIGVILGAAGVYEPFAEWAGAGASVPLTGFGNLLVQGTKKALSEQGLLGAVTGPLTSGAAGIMTAMLSGIIVSFFAKPKAPKV